MAYRPSGLRVASGAASRSTPVRHLLAHCLAKQGRHEAALEQFRLVDGYVDALPWRYYSNPAEVYCAVRGVALQGAAASRLAG